MTVISPLSELDAVNDMLLSVGQAPVSTLAVSGIQDVNVARSELMKVLRQVQTRGWHWNTDENVPLTPDADGHILVPNGALRVTPMSPADVLTPRRHETKGMALWNKTDRTFVFAEPIDFRIVWGFAFEDLPETARSFIATDAGRKFQANVIGSPVLNRFEETDVNEAWMLLEREERAQRKTNFFTSNTRAMSALSRRY